MKILVVSAGIVSDRRPHGEALIAHNILRRLGERGHHVTAFCTAHDVVLPGVDLRVIPADAPGAALSQLAFARRAARAAVTVDADVHHLLLPLTTSAGYTLAGGSPLVVGPLMLPWPSRDGEAPPRNRLVSAITRVALNRVERRLHDKTLERAARLLVTCAPARAALPVHLHDRCAEVPYGVDTQRFAVTVLPEEPTILFYSVLLPRKGFATLLRAFPLVRERIPRARLLIAGDDPRGLAAHVRRDAERLGIADAVEFLGPVAPADAPAVFARARVFCQPSDGEPFGMTILEAMASGRPVVATAAGGIPGFVKHGVNGRLVPARDERLLADALIATLIRPDEAEGIGVRNRADAVDRFDWERVVDGIEAAYRQASAAKEDRGVRLAG